MVHEKILNFFDNGDSRFGSLQVSRHKMSCLLSDSEIKPYMHMICLCVYGLRYSRKPPEAAALALLLPVIKPPPGTGTVSDFYRS